MKNYEGYSQAMFTCHEQNRVNELIRFAFVQVKFLFFLRKLKLQQETHYSHLAGITGQRSEIKYGGEKTVVALLKVQHSSNSS